jgi:[NiFe] hydrogenase assembly HybE family chaperone
MNAAESAPVQTRAAALAATFREVEATRMAGVALLHPRLRVEAVGFQPDTGDASVALGVLVTPWFMNLVRLPLDDAAALALAGVGECRTRMVETLEIDFLGADEASFGPFEACSLFSPMGSFADQAGAVATAREVLALVRAAALAPQPANAVHPTAAPARRAFLLGRSPVDKRVLP